MACGCGSMVLVHTVSGAWCFYYSTGMGRSLTLSNCLNSSSVDSVHLKLFRVFHDLCRRFTTMITTIIITINITNASAGRVISIARISAWGGGGGGWRDRGRER